MQNAIRFSAFVSALTLAVACRGGSPQQAAPQSQGGAAATEAAAAPAATPSTSAPSGSVPSGSSAPAVSSALSGAPAASSAAQTAGAVPGTGAAPTASAAPGASAAPAAPAALPMMPMDVASGTELHLILETPVSSDTAKLEQAVRARVAKPVVVAGMTVIAEGAAVTGTVVSAERAGRVKGRASLAIRFNRVIVASTPYDIRTASIVREAKATKGEDAKKVGIGAGAGAVIGAIAGGKKGAAIGTAVGGGAGAGAVLATRGDEVTLHEGTTLRTTIQETVRINAPM